MNPGAVPTRVLQISDFHLKASTGATLLGVDTAESLCAVLQQALSEHTPDAVIASGDLAHDATPPTYARCRRLLETFFTGPVLYLPGNHDLLQPMSSLLTEPPELRLGGWEIIGFDSHVDHRTEAELGDADRGVLKKRIRASQADHVLLVCHHPPVMAGCPWLDKDRIPRGQELLESVAAHERVRGLVFGHLHQEVEISHGHLAVLGAPSTCFQFEPGSPSFAIDRSARTGQPGYRWLELHPDGTLRSEVRRVAHFVMNVDLSDRS